MRERLRERLELSSTVQDIESEIEDVYRNSEQALLGAVGEECIPRESTGESLQDRIKIDEGLEAQDADLDIGVNREELENQLMLDVKCEKLDVANTHLPFTPPDIRIVQRE